MVDTNTLSLVLTGIGIIIALAYYTLTVRNQNRTRQAQLFMQLYETYRSQEFRKLQMLISRHEYIDFEDFWGKFGADVNLDAWSTWLTVAAYFNGIGVLVKKKLISIDLVEELLSNVITRRWQKMGPILVEYRETMATDHVRKHEVWHGFEYLANEMRARGTYPTEQ